ncbi:MAG: hypothetical protein D6718_00950, partial [Acidobacteria bacterium]
EQYGSVPDDPRVMSHLDDASPHGIYRTARDVLDRARREGRPPGAVALERAEELSRIPHPVWGHRGFVIVRSLTEGDWAG